MHHYNFTIKNNYTLVNNRKNCFQNVQVKFILIFIQSSL
jgi:hypothetical protein